MKKRKIVFTVVITALVVIIAVCGGILIHDCAKTKSDEKKYEEIASSYAHGTEPTAATEVTDASGVPLPPNPIDFAGLWKNENDEIYSWLTVPNTNVDYPVLRSRTDDNFYIDHGVDKQYSASGAIYSQYCNSKDYSDRVTVLYGHNMRAGTMFATLHRFEDADFFDKNKTMTVYTPYKKLDYEIVSAFVYDDSHIMNSFDFNKDEVYKSFLDNVLDPRSLQSNVRKGAKLDTSDRILILSTCLNYGEGRYLVVGKLTGETDLQPPAAQ